MLGFGNTFSDLMVQRKTFNRHLAYIMIKQEIVKYNDPVRSYKNQYSQHTNSVIVYPKIPLDIPSMGKLEYAMYLRNLPLKKGMVVVNKVVVNRPYHKWQCYLIEDILEIHRYVQYDNDAVGPLCLVLKHWDGDVCAWKGGGNQYKEAEFEHLPQEWKDKLIANLPD